MSREHFKNINGCYRQGPRLVSRLRCSVSATRETVHR